MIKAYILTIDEIGGNRFDHAATEAAALTMPWQFVVGVRLGESASAPEYSKLLNFVRYRRSMSRGEISVYLGHRRAWDQFLSDQVDFALILEDDFQVVDRYALEQAIKDAVACPDEWDVIKFFDVWSKAPIAKMDVGSTRFVCRRYPPNGAVAYLLNVRAANALLARKHIFRPVDEDISRPWEFSLRIWSTERNLVIENAKAIGGSLLDEQRAREELLKRKNPFRYFLMRNLLELNKFLRAKRYQRTIQRGRLCKPI